jgi:hypothetical protein
MEPVTHSESHLQHCIDKLVAEQQRTNELLLQLIAANKPATTTRKRKVETTDELS